MKWFRIELDSSGAILQCSEVESKAKGSAHIRYVEANDAASACSFAKQWYHRKLEQSRASKADRDSKRLCVARLAGCTGAQAIGHKSCQNCLDVKNAESRESYRAAREAAGSPAKSTPLKRLREPTGGSVKRRIALEAFDRLGPVKFREWLVSEIERVSRGH